jgi:hypothetical protein
MTPTRNFGIWNRGSARINGGTKDGLSAANHNGKNNAVYTQKDRQKEVKTHDLFNYSVRTDIL